MRALHGAARRRAMTPTTLARGCRKSFNGRDRDEDRAAASCISTTSPTSVSWITSGRSSPPWTTSSIVNSLFSLFAGDSPGSEPSTCVPSARATPRWTTSAPGWPKPARPGRRTMNRRRKRPAMPGSGLTPPRLRSRSARRSNKDRGSSQRPRSGRSISRAACETPGAGGLAQSSILLVNTHSPWIADWMPAPEDRRHAERWK